MTRTQAAAQASGKRGENHAGRNMVSLSEDELMIDEVRAEVRRLILLIASVEDG
jgi:hypothetical protein